MNNKKKYSLELISFLKSNPAISQLKLNSVKMQLCKKHMLKQLPLNSETLGYCNKKDQNKIKHLLQIKNVRLNAGVNVIAVMSPPKKCPHGRCIFCPGGVDENLPQSYTGYEPAAMRAKQNSYDSYKQTKNRLEQLKNVGHDISKLEIIVMGGTFPSYDFSFQKKFMKGVFDGVSFDEKKSKTFEIAKKKMEIYKYRPIGVTFETRPDSANKEQIKNMLYFGGTRVELGVQSLNDQVLKINNRKHTVKDVISATQNLKDSGFKVLYHIMPGLYKNKFSQDVKDFKKLFSEPFSSDMLKIYPCLVIKGTKLYDLWKKGAYKPYTNSQLEKYLSKTYYEIPYWVRLMRIQRDIPSTKIEAGPTKSNFRDIILKKLDLNKIKEIRAREVGKKGPPKTQNVKYFIEKYKASKGTEYFISAEDPNRETLFGFVRLRFPYKPFIETLKDSAIIRELHVYGNMTPVGQENKSAFGQHKGFGKTLLNMAEEIAKEKYNKLSVISGIGARQYYYKLGYKVDGDYVSKKL